MAKKAKGDAVVVYDVAEDKTRTEKASRLGKFGSKNTLNLCMKEKSAITVELFFLLLAIILLVILFVEYFGVYRPYLAVEEAEAQLEADRAKLQQTLDKLSDYDKVHEDYLKYNYDNYDKTLVDRLDVLDMLDRTVFQKGKVTSLTVSGATVSLTAEGIGEQKASELYVTLMGEKIVQSVTYNVLHIDAETSSLTMAITLKPVEGGN